MRRALSLAWLCFGALLPHAPATASVIIVPDGSVKLQDIVIQTPSGWRMIQDAVSDDAALAVFSGASGYVTVIAKRARGMNMREVFANGAQVVTPERRQRYGSRDWSILETKKQGGGSAQASVSAFMTEASGITYYGYSSAQGIDTARANAEAILRAMN